MPGLGHLDAIPYSGGRECSQPGVWLSLGYLVART